MLSAVPVHTNSIGWCLPSPAEQGEGLLTLNSAGPSGVQLVGQQRAYLLAHSCLITLNPKP